MGSSEVCVTGDIQASEDNQVTLWGPLCSGHLNVGMNQVGCEHIVADFDGRRCYVPVLPPLFFLFSPTFSVM